MKDLKTTEEEVIAEFDKFMASSREVAETEGLEYLELYDLRMKKIKSFLISKIHQAEIRGKIEGYREAKKEINGAF